MWISYNDGVVLLLSQKLKAKVKALIDVFNLFVSVQLTSVKVKMKESVFGCVM